MSSSWPLEDLVHSCGDLRLDTRASGYAREERSLGFDEALRVGDQVETGPGELSQRENRFSIPYAAGLWNRSAQKQTQGFLDEQDGRSSSGPPPLSSVHVAVEMVSVIGPVVVDHGGERESQAGVEALK